MKSSFMRPALAVALVLALAACGGKAAFSVGGTISGLIYPGLVLANGDATTAPAVNATTFSLNSIDYGTSYNVTVQTQPAHQACEVFNGADTAGRLATINIGVACALKTYTIGGNVTGLSTDGLVLTNGSTGGIVTVSKGTAAAPVPFTFILPVAYGSTFGVSVLTQPAGQTCSVANGTRTMGDADVADIVVTCV